MLQNDIVNKSKQFSFDFRKEVSLEKAFEPDFITGNTFIWNDF